VRYLLDYGVDTTANGRWFSKQGNALDFAHWCNSEQIRSMVSQHVQEEEAKKPSTFAEAAAAPTKPPPPKETSLGPESVASTASSPDPQPAQQDASLVDHIRKDITRKMEEKTRWLARTEAARARERQLLDELRRLRVSGDLADDEAVDETRKGLEDLKETLRRVEAVYAVPTKKS